jgi:hypothetical protein
MVAYHCAFRFAQVSLVLASAASSRQQPATLNFYLSRLWLGAMRKRLSFTRPSARQRISGSAGMA